ncbi:serine/threonine protein kinase [Singulisphaera sp. GP187]|uniref:serine/threonine protein kinase n=1 Tax=Singulisphaera sp. GP187 TaxID=1882752 RepID=UPI000940915F|nr:serine/threonine-protein kinase [Singulisphaera sp. GP187]
MGSEREEIERALGEFWFEHSTTRFDGRFHRCLGRDPIVFTSENRKSNDESRDAPDAGHPIYRGPHRDLKTANFARRILLVVAVVASLSANSSAQQGSGSPYHRYSAADASQSLEHLSTHLSEGSRRSVDRCVLLAGRTIEAETESVRAPSSPARPLRVGSWQGMKLANGRYQILDTLRQAAAGVVYLAHDRNLDADVIVEVPAFPPVPNHESKARFMRAVRSGARLVHPHLVKVTEVGTYENTPFVVAEHRTGGSLKFRRPVGPDGRPAPVAPRSLEQWLPDVADALDFLHARNRFSREVSLANILFDENGHASLGGLGMAEAMAEWLPPSTPGGSPPSANGQLAGGSAILAPEIVAGAPADGQSDQYALAATVYELLSGHPPFEGQTSAGVFEKETSIDPPELRQVCPTISIALCSAVHRGLARDPQQRFPDCNAFAQAVVSAARQSGPTPVPKAGSAVVRPTERSPLNPKRTIAGLPMIDRRETAPTNQVILGVACGCLIVVIGATARRKRSRATAFNQAVISTQDGGRAIAGSLPLAHSAKLDATPRSLADSTTHRGSENRVLDVRCHATELAGRPHFDQRPAPALASKPALLPALSSGRDLVQLPNLDPSTDRPKTRLADNLLPVASTVPARSESLPQVIGKRPLILARRIAS